MRVPMRRGKMKLSLAETKEIIDKGEYGVLSMFSLDHGVYGVPLNYILLNDALYFHSATDGYKVRNLDLHPEVSFCIVGKTKVVPRKITSNYESAIIWGNVVQVDGEEKYQALVGLLKKYAMDHLDKGIQGLKKGTNHVAVFKIEIAEISGKRKTN